MWGLHSLPFVLFLLVDSCKKMEVQRLRCYRISSENEMGQMLVCG